MLKSRVASSASVADLPSRLDFIILDKLGFTQRSLPSLVEISLGDVPEWFSAKALCYIGARSVEGPFGQAVRLRDHSAKPGAGLWLCPGWRY